MNAIPWFIQPHATIGGRTDTLRFSTRKPSLFVHLDKQLLQLSELLQELIGRLFQFFREEVQSFLWRGVLLF